MSKEQEQLIKRINSGKKIASTIGGVLPTKIENNFAVIATKGHYIVQFSQKKCTCADFKYRQVVCKHIFAVQFFRKALSKIIE